MTMGAHGRGLPTTMGGIVAAMQRYGIAFVLALPSALRQHVPIFVVIFVHWIAGLIVCWIIGISPAATVTIYSTIYPLILAWMIVFLVIGRALLIMFAERSPRPLTQLASELRTSLVTPQRIAHAAPILICMLVFGGLFTLIKSSISTLAPFSWDVAFEEWDRWLHGGKAPWELLYPLFGTPLATQALNWMYNSWIVVLNLVWVWQAFSRRDPKSRAQFFLTLFLGSMLLGNLAAILLSSAGPCYFGKVTGLPDPFEPLMTHLRTIDLSHNLWALGTQDMLWEAHAARTTGIGVGISAMPSMHVAVATLFALIGWRTNRLLGVVMSIYAVLIMIGSVHLGWHYAIDGYAGAVGIGAIWWVVGRLLERRDKGRWTRLAPGSTVADETAPR